jgi:hypothetical protein
MPYTKAIGFWNLSFSNVLYQIKGFENFREDVRKEKKERTYPLLLLANGLTFVICIISNERL